MGWGGWELERTILSVGLKSSVERRGDGFDVKGREGKY